MHKSVPLEDVFPVWKIEDDCLIDKCGSVTIGYSLLLPEIFTVSTAVYERMHESWVKAAAVLPIGVIVHKQDWFTEAKYTVDFEKDERSFLQHCSDRFFFERSYFDQQCYVYLTMPPVGRSPVAAWTSIVPASAMDEKRIHAFLDKAEQFLSILCDGGLIAARRLTAGDLESTIDKPGLLEQYCTLSIANSPRLVRDISLGENLAVGNLTVQVFSLCEPDILPVMVGARINHDPYSTDQAKFSVGFTAPLGLLLPVDHIYNQYLIMEDKEAVVKQLEKKRLRLQSLSAYSRNNAINRDQANEFLNDAIGEGMQPVKAHFNVICFSESEDKKRKVANKVASAMSQIGAKAKEETDSASQLFWAGIPGNAFGLPANETFLTFADQAACFLNAETNYRSSLSPHGLRLGDRLNGLPLHVDLSDEPVRKGIINNRNKFVLGPSGSGKSMFCNHLIRSAVEQGTHAVIVDVGHSYKGLCELLGGYYFTFSETEPISFNPFYVEEVLDTEKKESLKTLLLALWKKDDEAFTRSEYVALSNALKGFYQSNKGIACFDSFYEYLETGFKKRLRTEQVKEKDFDIDNFLYVLRPYYKGGEFDYLLNATENLNLLDQRLIVFELDTIKDHPILFPVVTLVIMDVFLAKMRKLKGVRKIILIEEAWKAIARNGMAEYTKYLFKTIRKFFGEAIVVTQDIEDIIHSPIVRDTIINNSDCKILLDQSKYLNRFAHIQELLGLTEKEKMLVLSLNKANDPLRKYKEVFISLGGTHAKVYRVELSPEEYLAYTTEEKEKLQVQVYAKRYGSLEKGIKVLAQHLQGKHA